MVNFLMEESFFGITIWSIPDAGQEIYTHGERSRNADQYFSKRRGTLAELESRDQEMEGNLMQILTRLSWGGAVYSVVSIVYSAI
jgi:hypothetical protein